MHKHCWEVCFFDVSIHIDDWHATAYKENQRSKVGRRVSVHVGGTAQKRQASCRSIQHLQKVKDGVTSSQGIHSL